jgi:hypothetical protein
VSPNAGGAAGGSKAGRHPDCAASSSLGAASSSAHSADTLLLLFTGDPEDACGAAGVGTPSGSMSRAMSRHASSEAARHVEVDAAVWAAGGAAALQPAEAVGAAVMQPSAAGRGGPASAIGPADATRCRIPREAGVRCRHRGRKPSPSALVPRGATPRPWRNGASPGGWPLAGRRPLPQPRALTAATACAASSVVIPAGGDAARASRTGPSQASIAGTAGRRPARA